MTIVSSSALLPPSVRQRSGRHYRVHDAAIRRFRLDVQAALSHEVDRMARAFATGPLAAQTDTVLPAFREYVSWLGWCVWCSSHLAPPLGLVTASDARRMAAALLVYAGPRLIDDALDDHRTYKNVRETLLERLIVALPDREPGDVRCQVVLLGSWLTFYGLQRLARHGLPDADRRTLRLCERIAPGVLLETLHASPLTWEQYRQIVWLKSVSYDQILYRNLLDPVDEPVRERLLDLCAGLSALAQYLNDYRDRADDGRFGRGNAMTWFASDDAFWDFCRTEALALVAAFDQVPAAAGDACAAALVETVDAVARLESRAVVATLT